MAKKPASFEYNGTLVRVLDGDIWVLIPGKVEPEIKLRKLKD